MGLFDENKKTKILWPKFIWVTGNKIDVEITESKNKFSNKEKLEIEDKNIDIDEQILNEKNNEKLESVKKSKTEKAKVIEKINIQSGTMLRIDGIEYQKFINIKENEEVTTEKIKKAISDPNGEINKWEYRDAELKYDANDKIFYLVIESPKKG